MVKIPPNLDRTQSPVPKQKGTSIGKSLNKMVDGEMRAWRTVNSSVRVVGEWTSAWLWLCTETRWNWISITHRTPFLLILHWQLFYYYCSHIMIMVLTTVEKTNILQNTVNKRWAATWLLNASHCMSINTSIWISKLFQTPNHNNYRPFKHSCYLLYYPANHVPTNN